MAKEAMNVYAESVMGKYSTILHSFDIPDGDITDVKAMKSGRLNETNLLVVDDERKYVLQKVNADVFKDPVKLMENIVSVTGHILAKGGTTIFFHKVKENKVSPYLYYDEAENAYYRLYDFIEEDFKNAVTDASDMYAVGKAIGVFSKQLEDFDATKLVETIKDFHNTAKRYDHFKRVCLNEMFRAREKVFEKNRIDTCIAEIQFIEERSSQASLIVDALQDGSIPQRVSHNDPKLNNVILSKKTGEALGFIDLDTIMPGTVLYDFGDAARFGCNTADEEETDITKVHFNLKYFKALTKGLLETMADVLTVEEVTFLADSAWMMTYELCIRFLDDHIDGNKYFGVAYDGKNLERARVQMALLADMENQWDDICESIVDTWSEVRGDN